MTLENRNNEIIEILTSISLIGCFLNILTLVHDLYLFSSKDYLTQYLYLGILSVTTVLCLHGILKLREGKIEGFKFYLLGQIGEFGFYVVVLLFINIPKYSNGNELGGLLANASFVKNIIPLSLMTFLHYVSIKHYYSA